MSGEMFVQGAASDAPSKVTEPIITASSGTVPTARGSSGSPDNGLRSPTSPARVSNGDSREKRLK